MKRAAVALERNVLGCSYSCAKNKQRQVNYPRVKCETVLAVVLRANALLLQLKLRKSKMCCCIADSCDYSCNCPRANCPVTLAFH